MKNAPSSEGALEWEYSEFDHIAAGGIVHRVAHGGFQHVMGRKIGAVAGVILRGMPQKRRADGRGQLRVIAPLGGGVCQMEAAQNRVRSGGRCFPPGR